VRWLGTVLYSALFKEDLRAEKGASMASLPPETDTRSSTRSSPARADVRFGPRLRPGSAWCGRFGRRLVAIALVGSRSAPSRAGYGDLVAAALGEAGWRRIPGRRRVETVGCRSRPRVLAAMAVRRGARSIGDGYQARPQPLSRPTILALSGRPWAPCIGIYLALPVLAIQGLAFVGGLAPCESSTRSRARSRAAIRFRLCV